MKYINLLFSALCAVMLTTACENGNNNDLPNNPDESKCYKGSMTVDQNDGTLYTQEDVEVDYEIKGDKLNFVMYKVKFANGMPIKLDMVVEGVNYTEVNGSYTITGDDIVPYAMGGPFEKYTITNLTGIITDTSFTLDFMCGEYPVTYDGAK
ncbi:MAG: hypothetical protein E7135_07365 [Rikenellaceae bacterium]|nr:hypothetical protein [Rikenellaceae bacterium]